MEINKPYLVIEMMASRKKTSSTTALVIQIQKKRSQSLVPGLTTPLDDCTYERDLVYEHSTPRYEREKLIFNDISGIHDGASNVQLRHRSLSTSTGTADNKLEKLERVKAETDVVLLKQRGIISKRISRLPQLPVTSDLQSGDTTTRRHSCQN